MAIPAIHLVKTDDMDDTSPLMMDAVEMHLRDSKILKLLLIVFTHFLAT